MRETEMFVLMGIRGSGKSTLAKRLVGPPTPGEKTVIVDTGGWLAASGFAARASLEDAADAFRAAPSYRIAVNPSSAAEVEWLIDACAARWDTTVLVDELDVWYPTHAHLPCAGLRNIALTGRHYGQTAILVSHRPQNVHPILLSQSVLYVFPMTDSRDCRAVQQHSRRASCPDGVDPAGLAVVESDTDGRTLQTEVARIDRHGARRLVLSLPSGLLTDCG
jgi:energy-coupling factor transporter ATP-binding protein EcfA2